MADAANRAKVPTEPRPQTRLGPRLPRGWAWVQLEFFVAVLLVLCALGTLINKGWRLESINLPWQADRWVIAQAFAYVLLVLVSGLFLADLRDERSPGSRWSQVLWSATWGCAAVFIAFFPLSLAVHVGWHAWPYGKPGPVLGMLLVAAIFFRRVYRSLWPRVARSPDTDS